MPGFTTSTAVVDPPDTLIDVSADGNIATFRATGTSSVQEIFGIEIATGRRIEVARYDGPFSTGSGPNVVEYGPTGGQVSSDGRYVMHHIGEIRGAPVNLAAPSQVLIKDLFTGATRTVVDDTSPGVGLMPLGMDGSGSVVLFQRVSGSGTMLVARNLTTGTEQIFEVSNFTFLAQGSVFDALSADGRRVIFREARSPSCHCPAPHRRRKYHPPMGDTCCPAMAAS
jgi:hypothetical protein